MNFLPIKKWAEEERPREKLLHKGVDFLTDAELLAILLGTGTTKKTAVALAQDILQLADSNLVELSKKTILDFMKIKGIGQAKAITIIAALELGKRRRQADALQRNSITTSQEAYHLLSPMMESLEHEEFWVIYLSRANKVIKYSQLSIGGISGTVIDIRLLLKECLENLASSIIIAHNHPSGNLAPSQADRDITAKIAQAAKLLDIQLLDHLIITDTAYNSFGDNGWE